MNSDFLVLTRKNKENSFQSRIFLVVVPRALVFRVLFKLKQKFSKVSRSSGHVLKCLLSDRAILEYIWLVAKTQGARGT